MQLVLGSRPTSRYRTVSSVVLYMVSLSSFCVRVSRPVCWAVSFLQPLHRSCLPSRSARSVPHVSRALRLHKLSSFCFFVSYALLLPSHVFGAFLSCGLVRCGTARFGSVRFGSVRFGSDPPLGFLLPRPGAAALRKRPVHRGVLGRARPPLPGQAGAAAASGGRRSTGWRGGGPASPVRGEGGRTGGGGRREWEEGMSRRAAREEGGIF